MNRKNEMNKKNKINQIKLTNTLIVLDILNFFIPLNVSKLCAATCSSNRRQPPLSNFRPGEISAGGGAIQRQALGPRRKSNQRRENRDKHYVRGEFSAGGREIATGTRSEVMGKPSEAMGKPSETIAKTIRNHARVARVTRVTRGGPHGGGGVVCVIFSCETAGTCFSPKWHMSVGTLLISCAPKAPLRKRGRSGARPRPPGRQA